MQSVAFVSSAYDDMKKPPFYGRLSNAHSDDLQSWYILPQSVLPVNARISVPLHVLAGSDVSATIAVKVERLKFMEETHNDGIIVTVNSSPVII